MSSRSVSLLHLPRRFCAVCIFGVLVSVLSGCPSNTKQTKREYLAPRGQLYERVRLFNELLRWQAYQRAKVYVAPEQHSSFVLHWEKQRPNLRITGFVIRDVSFVKRGKLAIVLVAQQRYRLPSVTLRQRLLQQKWASEEGVWYYKGDKLADVSSPKRRTPPPVRRPVARTPAPVRPPARTPTPTTPPTR